MKYELIIIRYGEIGLKAKETRKRFEDILVSNIKNAFISKNLSSEIKKERGRIYVYTTHINECINVLQKIFGITSVSPAFQTSSEIRSMSKLAVNLSKKKLSGKKTFALRVTRTGKHDFTSQDVAIKIGNDTVKETKAIVNLTKPDLELFVEVRNDKAFIFTEKIRGTGGMPLGTQGNVLSIIENVESILAAWYLMRRGCKSIFLKTETLNDDIIKSFLDNWFIKTEIITINSKEDIFTEINKILTQKNCEAIVTGHTFSSGLLKTMDDLKDLKKQFKIPILTPLISMGKKDVHKKCREIGLQA